MRYKTEAPYSNRTMLEEILSPVALPSIGPTLRRGATGLAVSALQRALSSLGHDLAIDGAFGPRTERSVRAFQARAGIGVDGIVGPRTRAALADALAKQGHGPASGPVALPPSAPQPTPPPASGSIVVPVPQPCVQVPRLLEPDRGCLAVHPAGFAGVPAIRSFATALAKCAAGRLAERRARGQSIGKRATALVDLNSLERDFADTMRAAHGRMKERCRFTAIARGWMFGRREEVDFETLGTGGRYLNIGGLLPPTGHDRLEPMEVDPDKNAPVQPLMNRFLRALRGRYPFAKANNYSRTHGGGNFKGRGYSVDLYIAGGVDERGFYHRDRAVAMLLAVDAAATAVGAEWRVLYNDYAVAAAVNRRTRIRRVVFVGETRPGGTNLNWHGPLLLHFHLDIAPRSRSE